MENKKYKVIEAYECLKCGHAYRTPEAAEKCCADKHCERCGAVLPDKYYFTLCQKCREEIEEERKKEAIEKATKMSLSEYLKKYPNLMFTDNNDNYWTDIDDFMDFCEMNEWIPEYIYGTYETYATIDIEYAMDCALDDSYEDAEFDPQGVKELEDFIKDWNEKYKVVSYLPDTSIVLYLSDNEKEEIEHLISNGNV